MTISTETTKSATTVGNGVTTAFPFAFKIFQTSDVSVVLAVVATGVETVLTEGVDYSVSMNADQEADPGGEVTYPLSGSPMASTHTLTLVRDVPYTQGLDLTLGGSFNPDNIEKALDRVTTLVQQLKEAVGRAVKVSISSGLTPDEFFLDNITNAEVNANAAAASAAAALASETAALASETAAVAAAEDFLSRYVGASASDPVADGNGDALTEGSLYWNTAVPEFRVYRSGAWVAFLDPGALPVTPFAETLLDDTDAATARTTLEVFSGFPVNWIVQTIVYTMNGYFFDPNGGAASSRNAIGSLMCPFTGTVDLSYAKASGNTLNADATIELYGAGTNLGVVVTIPAGSTSVIFSSAEFSLSAGTQYTMKYTSAATSGQLNGLSIGMWVKRT